MTGPSARLPVAAWAIAFLAAPLAAALLRLAPATSIGDAGRWLVPLAAGVVCLAAAIATARWLARALRGGVPADTLVVTAAAAMAAASGVTALDGTQPALIPVTLGAAVAAVTLLGASLAGGRPALGIASVAGVTLGTAVLVAAGGLFVPWPPASGPALGAAATALALAAGWTSLRRGGAPLWTLAPLAGAGATLGLARPGTVEGILGLVPLLAAALLLAIEPSRGRVAGSGTAAAARPAHATLPPLAHHLGEGILLLDRDERIVDWNVAAAGLLELGADPRGQPAVEVLAPLVGDAAWTHLATPGSGQRGRMLTQRGRPLELTAVDEGKDGIIVVVRDLSLERGEQTEAARLARELRGTIEELLDARRTVELQRAEIERASQVDAVTGVESRRALLDRLRTEAAQGRRYSHPVALVVVDVDDFAAINRTHGLAVGDAVLRELALRLRLRVREADALGRLSGDCFAAILPHTDERGAAVFADAVLRRLVARPIETAAGPVAVTVSLGVALMRPGMDLDDEGLLAAADEALASARRGGGNRIAFDRRHGLIRLDEGRRATDAADAADASVEEETAQDSGA
ncbi:MAG TPA: diguanylate cyclase [Candidatus Limnocylindria bacterium]|nr:diguanylate cyclase [Candidatus Limnocylindria bacterium]